MSRPTSPTIRTLAMFERLWNGSIKDVNYSKIGGQETTVDCDETETQQRHVLRFALAIAAWLSTASLAAFMFVHLSTPHHRNQKQGFFPPALLTPHPQTFTHTPFAGTPAPETDALWATIIPTRGRGFVAVHEPERYGLTKPGMVLHPQFDAPGDGGSGNETAGVEEMYYSVSVFHQLHCLGVIRRGYYGGVRGVGVGDGDVGGSGEHVGHCFDYLRQAVQCNGDTTLEFANEELDFNGRHSNVDGWGVTHEHCKDWDALWKWTVGHSVPEEGS